MREYNLYLNDILKSIKKIERERERYIYIQKG